MKTANVRDALVAKLKVLRPIAKGLEKLPELKAALSARRAEQAALLNDPKFYGPGDDDRRRAVLAADAAVVTAAEAVRNVEGPGEDARREIERIESLLGAENEVKRLGSQLKEDATEGANVERQTIGSRDWLSKLGDKRALVEKKMAAERKDAAARANAAEREGKPLPTTKPGGSSFAQELTFLDDRIADEKGRFAELTEKLHALAERANSTRSELLRALARAAEFDYLQAIEDARPFVERRVATARVAGMGYLISDSAFPVDEVAVRALVNEIQAEYRGWEPAALTAPPALADVDASESAAEPGAQAAA
jgi:hypothetical protein